MVACVCNHSRGDRAEPHTHDVADLSVDAGNQHDLEAFKMAMGASALTVCDICACTHARAFASRQINRSGLLLQFRTLAEVAGRLAHGTRPTSHEGQLRPHLESLDVLPRTGAPGSCEPRR